MQQMSLQMSSFNTPIGMVNSTYQPLVPMPMSGFVDQPFQPSPTDIRVNVLWFASLIFSLITASFGILIKQWLREYLAVTNPSPQARLRIRHFRYPELERWKVVEIAGVLPLLQQLSLAFFFIGLCYFTESVHSSIGRTTLPLVAGWAFCFVTATILPLFFPRCPYKTTLLKQILKYMHFKLARTYFQLTKRQYGPLSRWLRASQVANLRRYDPVTEYIETYDEQAVLASESADLDILEEVDAIQSNDELLGTVIFGSLQQIHSLHFEGLVIFVLRVLEHRLSHKDLGSRKPAPIDLRNLSQRGYNAIINILVYFMVLQDPHTLLQTQEGIYAFHIIFSESRFPLKLPHSGIKFLNTMFQNPNFRRSLAKELIEGWTTGFEVTQQQSNYLSLRVKIYDMLRLLNVELELAWEFFYDTLHAWFDRGPGHFLLHPKFILIGKEKDYTEYDIAMEYLMDRGLRSPQPGIPSGDALNKIYNLVNEAYREPNRLRGEVIKCLLTQEYTMALLVVVRRIETSAFILSGDYHYSDINLRDVPSQGIENLAKSLDQLRSKPVEPDFALRLLCLGTHLVTQRTARQFTNQWRSLFKVLTDLTQQLLLAKVEVVIDTDDSKEESITQSRIEATFPVVRSDRPYVVAQCLDYIQFHDSWECSNMADSSTEEDQRSKWSLEFTSEDSAYPDEFVAMLAAIYFAPSRNDADDSKWWRVQKLGVKEKVRNRTHKVILPPAPETPPTTRAPDSSVNPSDVTKEGATDGVHVTSSHASPRC
jgi:hypothetical protein